MLKNVKNRAILAVLVIAMLGLTSCDNRTDRQKAEDYVQQALKNTGHDDIDQKINLYTKAIKADPTFPAAYDLRASCYNCLCNYGLALDDMNKVIELNPAEPRHFFDRGDIYASMEDYDNAIADYSKTLALGLQHPLVYECRAEAYEAIGKTDLAQADREKAIELRQIKEEQATKPANAPDAEE
ncbi:MAG: hypothetical protein JEZ07_12355 [Phycisphaerae bacterium]|nr:hypothetical protein [Phycisphaerae bacterium]